MTNPARPHGTRYDLKVVFNAVWLLLLFWTAAVVGAAVSGFPGVTCATPAGWLISFAAGVRVAQTSGRPRRQDRLWEAALAGAVVGVWQAVLAGLIAGIFMPLDSAASITAQEGAFTGLTVFLVLGVVGSLVCGLISLGMAAYQTRYWIDD